ncbi:hypothetical protein AAEX28_02875 [Lentisphaerota bacterium WC36G]|nr:hypothetical protein LJT99_05755 [Lentisphaerae bacterium WC36]
MKISFNKQDLSFLIAEITKKKYAVSVSHIKNNTIYLKVANIIILIKPIKSGGNGQIIYFEVKLNNYVLQLSSLIAGFGGKSVVDYLVKISDGILEKNSTNRISLNLLKLSHRYNFMHNYKVSKITAQNNTLNFDINIESSLIKK